MRNNRSIKNIVLIVILLASLAAMIFTSYNTIKSNTITTNNTQENANNKGEPPERPSGEMGEPPAKPEENSKEEDKAPSMGSDALDEESTTSNNEKNESTTSKPKPPQQQNLEEQKNNFIIPTNFYIVFGIEALIFSLCLVYLIESRMNKKDFQDIFLDIDKITIFILSTIIITSLIVLGGTKIINSITPSTINEPIIEEKTNDKTNDIIPNKEPNNNKEEVSATATNIITEEKELTGPYESNNTDESVILVKDGANALLSDITLTKKGDGNNIENSDFYGINSAILVQKESTATINNANITTSGKGSNAVFSTGSNSKIYINDSKIDTNGSNSARGLDATYGGYIEADNVTITTFGNSSATLATDRGEGTIKVSNSKLTTQGKGSPLIYSTGDISITNTEGTSNDSQLVVVEGKNSATISDSSLIAAGTGNRNNIDKSGVMIYQSMSGDAEKGIGSFTANNSILTISDKSDVYKTAPMFFVTNTNAEINLTNTKLNYGSNILLSIAGTSEWGTNGTNGGNVTLNTNNQTLSGKIIVDNISTLNINFTKTSYRGSINYANIAKEINLKLDKDSKLYLTADTYLTSLENEDKNNSNIEFNEYKLYVNGTEVTRK